MVAVGHAAQRAQRLALRPRRDDDDAVVGPVVELARRDQRPLRHDDVTERAPDVDVLAHRAADQARPCARAPRRRRRPAARGGCSTRSDVVTIRPWQRANTRSRFGPTTLSDDRRPGPVRVRRVAAQQQHPVAPQLGEPRHVGRRAADRRLVELVVAGEQDGPELAAQDHPDHVRDRVRQVDELDLERARLHLLARREHLEIRLAQPVLVELGARHRDRQLAAVDHGHRRLPQVAQHPRQRADVVLVPVGDDDRLDVLDVLAQVREVRAARGRCPSSRRSGSAGRSRPRRSCRRTRRRSCSCRSRRRPPAGGRAGCRSRRGGPLEQPVALEHRADLRGLVLVRVDHRQPARPRVQPEQVQRRLGAGRAGRQEQRRVDVAQRGVDLRPRARARRTGASSPAPTTCEATQMPPAPPRSSVSAAGCRRCRPARRARRSAAARRRWPA